MKCTACGYEHDNTKPGEYSVETTLGNGGTMKTTYKNGGKPFVEIYGLLTTTRGTLYACPNCGTVRMEV